ncbi:DUF5384 family protein [Photobacterium sp. BZF1]|uniref:DUF5384 family protein n=1 Tax=Photobacterium sp. BZF1 TaxID=1904457 RepID=UPI0016539FEB|nr:DUF5384 family protein [Photobacterium sp. BZF1]MBC7006080.1 DUF5384 family protein [Photobacterium sp. BZF1]
MWKIVIALAVVLSVPVQALSLEEQIANVAHVENQQEAQRLSEQRAMEKAKREAAQLAAKIEADKRRSAEAVARKKAEERKRAQAVANQKKAEAAQLELLERMRAEDERLADKKRDQDYEDLKRMIEIEELRAELAMKKAKAQRADEYIDRDLERQDVSIEGHRARNDVTQSEADATRVLADGASELMKKEGEARVEANSGLFN